MVQQASALLDGVEAAAYTDPVNGSSATPSAAAVMMSLAMRLFRFFFISPSLMSDFRLGGPAIGSLSIRFW